ncbi:hypothetical protein PN36_07930 [Candidatus Thiomargarita nelsonii]|uniref:Uncharacterized protein n=1 Tax=Candidatus Thiomargarita nelsonii TaxID=1003181 RepID=A0A0A6P6R3_9GAMM|nr:hypothetical protein PN36_07930 [Candidatus Thiomargarita nelsonii]
MAKIFSAYVFSDNPEKDAKNVSNLIMSGKKLLFMFSGYDNDEREVYDIPECLNHFELFCIALARHHGIEEIEFPKFLINNMFAGSSSMDGVAFVQIMMARLAGIDIQIIKDDV